MKPYDDASMAGVPETIRGHWMQVRGGRVFYPLDPKPEDVFIEDIVYSLSRINRYNGFADAEIKVAQHLVNCQWMAHMDGHDVSTQYAILMHDASEAYIGDMIRPLKCDMLSFREIESHVQGAINAALNVPDGYHAIIKHYDNICWAWEKRDHFKCSLPWPNTPRIPDYCPTMNIWSTMECEMFFRDTFTRYKAGHEMNNAVPSDEEWASDHWEGQSDMRDWRNV